MTRLVHSFVKTLLLITLLIVPTALRAAESTTAVGFEVRHGVNISHWLSQSGKRGQQRQEWFTESDMQFIAQIGYDHIRLPVDEEQLWDEAGGKEPEAFRLLHAGISWAQKHKLRVIVDLHVLRSHHFNAKQRPLWTDPSAQQRFLQLWQDLSSELQRYSVEQVAYELMNEPVADDPEDWNKLVAKGIEVIRQREPQRVIVIGSNKWQQIDTMPALKLPAGDKNLLLSFHFYEPFLVTHHQASWTHIAKYRGPVHYPGLMVEPQDKVGLSEEELAIVKNADVQNRDRLEKRIVKAAEIGKRLGLPLYCGEWGCIDLAPRDVRLAWYRDMVSILDQYHIAWANWDYKGGFGICERTGEPDSDLIEILTGNRP